MRREHRLRTSGEFRHVLRGGRSVAADAFVLYYARRDGQRRPRCGFAVSRRIGGAVVRNRVKRLLREACRPLIPRLEPSVDMVVVARPAIVGVPLGELAASVEEAASRAGLMGTEEGTSR